MDKIKKFFKGLFTVLKDNVKRPNFWVSLITLGLVVTLVVLKLIFKVDITNTSILGVITSLGIVISLIGQMLGNSSVVSAGESLDATKITSAADKLAGTLQSIADQVDSLTKETTNTQKKVTKVAKAVGVEDTTSDDETATTGATITTSLGSVLDSDGNIIGTAQPAATVVAPGSAETVKKTL